MVMEMKKIVDDLNYEELTAGWMSVEEENKWYEGMIRDEARKEGLAEGRAKGIAQLVELKDLRMGKKF